MRDFNEFTSFCMHDNTDIPPDDSPIEWATFVGCTTGSSISMQEVTTDGAPPVTASEFFEVITDNMDLLSFLAKEDGAIVTYKRVTGGPSFVQPGLQPLEPPVAT